MADTTNDGGPAFPTENAMRTGPSSCRYEGITARDYFAAKAIQGLACSEITLWPIGATDSDYPTDALYMARTAYLIADAMLKARDGE